MLIRTPSAQPAPHVHLRRLGFVRLPNFWPGCPNLGAFNVCVPDPCSSWDECVRTCKMACRGYGLVGLPVPGPIPCNFVSFPTTESTFLALRDKPDRGNEDRGTAVQLCNINHERTPPSYCNVSKPRLLRNLLLSLYTPMVSCNLVSKMLL
jgi:hypothetical protein